MPLFMDRRFICVVSLLCFLPWMRVSSQANLVAPAPLLPVTADRGQSIGEGLLQEQAAIRAMELGFPSVAVGILRAELTEQPAELTQRRNRLAILLATALLDDDLATEAEEALRLFVGLPTPPYRLRAAMTAIRLRRFDVARVELSAVRVDELEPSERGWYYFAEGQLAAVAGEFSRSGPLFDQALGTATTELQRARFTLAREEIRLLASDFSEGQLAGLRSLLERNPGRSTGYEAASLLALTLNGLGRRTEAIETLRRQLQALPQERLAIADEWYLLLGLIAGANDAIGRNALGQLLDHSKDREKQRVALMVLARGAPPALFRAELNRLIEAPTPHPVLEDLLIQRAEIHLQAKSYAEAERDVERMLEMFPGSRLKPQALSIRVLAAWETLRYRRAADYATQTRAALAPTQVQVGAELGVLVAEAYFRAADFRLAADAYAAALNQVPVGVPAGDLIFQRVLSEIESAQADPTRLLVAAGLLDEASLNPRLDVTNRWPAEWNLARAMQVAGPESRRIAFERIERLLGSTNDATSSSPELPDDLKVRMAWLRARLSLEVGQPERTLTLVDQLVATLPAIDPRLRSDIASTSRLLQADAYFELPGREVEGLDILRKLRSDFPQSDAAVYSFIKEADFAADQNRFVDAQSLLVKLADDFGKHTYAPFALYLAAVNAERRGQDTFYRDANRLIERLIRDYPRSELVFYARLKQGDLLRRLNEFPFAQQAYEELINAFPKHPDVLYAHLARAACHNAQAGAGAAGPGQLTGHAEIALGIYERLVDQADAPTDIRIEAGYNLGLLLSRRGKEEGRKRAELVWWQQVITPFLLDSVQEAKLSGSAKGRYWMSRALLGLGDLFESQMKLDQAIDTYSLLLNKGLPGSSLAKARLARLGVQR